MNMWRKTEPERLPGDVFERIGKRWMLISARKEDGTVNTMTASWGGMGVLWNKKVAFAFIRPQRYTREFVEEAGRFTLSFFDEEWRDRLRYLGRVSGRDEDKIAIAGLTEEELDGAPAFAEAAETLVCRTLYVQQMDPAAFADKNVEGTNYPQKDYHWVYVGEIESAYVSE